MSLLGGLFGGSQEQAQTNEPWHGAAPMMVQNLGMVQYANDRPWTQYGGETVAPLQANQILATHGANAFYTGQGNDAKNAMFDTAHDNLRGYDAARAGYADAMGWDPAVNNGPDLGMAGRIADNPYMDSMIDAASRDVTRNLTEQQLPGIANDAAGSGNLGSSRRGMLEGMAIRGAGDRIADIGAGMRGNAYSQGINAASAAAQQNANLTMQNRGQQMQAMQGMQSLGNAGQQGINNGFNLQNQGIQSMMNIGNMFQGQRQNVLSQQAADHYSGQRIPYEQAAMGMGIALPASQAFGQQASTGGGGMGIGNQLLNVGSQLGAGYLMGM